MGSEKRIGGGICAAFDFSIPKKRHQDRSLTKKKREIKMWRKVFGVGSGTRDSKGLNKS